MSRISLLLAVALLAAPAGAEEVWSPAKTLAVGGAGVAFPLDNASVTLNPAAMVLPTGRYAIETGYQRFDATRSDVFHASAVDSKTSLLAIGVSQTFQWTNPPFDPRLDMSWYDHAAHEDEALEDKHRVDRFTWAMAYGFFQRRFNVGASLKIYHVRDQLRGNRTQVTMDAGLTWWVSPNVVLGVAGNNLVATKLDSAPRTLAAGFGFSVGNGLLWLEADGVIDFDSGDKVEVDLRAGAQLTLLQQIDIRAGYGSNAMFGEQYVSWGLGWTVPQFSVGYTMRIEVDDMERRLNDNKTEGANRLLHAWLISLGF